MNANSRIIGTCTAILLASSTALTAQDGRDVPSYASRFNIATYAGASIPTGKLRDSFDSGLLLGAQGTYDLGTHAALLGAFNWSNPNTKLVPADARANIYQADLGLELGGARDNTRRWAMRPFVDVGGGLRRYDYASNVLSDHTRGEGFASVGTELAVGRSAIRLAATDNVFSFQAPTADATRATRNDIGLSLGFGFHP